MTKPAIPKGLRSIPLNEEQRKLLVHRRKELGLTQEQLARKLGCLKLSVSNVETGKHQPTPEMLSKMCKALGLEWDLSIFVHLRPKKQS